MAHRVWGGHGRRGCRHRRHARVLCGPKETVGGRLYACDVFFEVVTIDQLCVYLAPRSSKKDGKVVDEAVEEETRAKTTDNGAAGDGVYNMSFSDDERFTEM